MSSAGQLDFPIEISARPLGGNCLCVADTAAVRAAEARPFLSGGLVRPMKEVEQKGEANRTVNGERDSRSPAYFGSGQSAILLDGVEHHVVLILDEDAIA